MNPHTAIVCAALLAGTAAGGRVEDVDAAPGTTGTVCCADKDLNLKTAQGALAKASEALSKYTLGKWIGFDKTTDPCSSDERYTPVLIETFKLATLNCRLETLVEYTNPAAKGKDVDLPRKPYKELADPAIRQEVIRRLLPESVLQIEAVQALVADVHSTYEYQLGTCASPGACLDVFVRSKQVAADTRVCREARALLGSRMAAFGAYSACSAQESCGKYEFRHAAKYEASAAEDKDNFKLWAILDMMIARSDLCELQGEGAVKGADLIKALDIKGKTRDGIRGARLQLLEARLKED